MPFFKWRDPEEVFQAVGMAGAKVGRLQRAGLKERQLLTRTFKVLNCRDRETEAQAGAEMAQVLQWFMVDPGCLMDSVGVRGRLSPGSGRAPLPCTPVPPGWVRERQGCDLVPATLDGLVWPHLGKRGNGGHIS